MKKKAKLRRLLALLMLAALTLTLFTAAFADETGAEDAGDTGAVSLDETDSTGGGSETTGEDGAEEDAGGETPASESDTQTTSEAESGTGPVGAEDATGAAETEDGEATVGGTDTAVDSDTADTASTAATLQERIDALPSVEEYESMDEDGQLAVYMEAMDISDIYYDELTEEEQEAVSAEKLLALLEYFSEQTEPLSLSAVYLNGETGSDENTGSSTNPVATFEKAAELAEEIGNKVILVTGTVTVSDTQTWSGGYTLLRDTSFTGGSLVEVTGTLTLEDVTIDGNNVTVASTSTTATDFDAVPNLVYVNGGTLNITDGAVIQNHVASRITENTYSAAVLLYCGTINMSGGTICDNTGYKFGGGIVVWGASSDNAAVMTLTGGTISKNTSTSTGGGIYLWGYATLNMSGGSITGNSTVSDGGGVYIGSGSVAIITAGYITYNKQTSDKNFGGGGIYVHSGVTNSASMGDLPAGQLYLYNVEITGNSFSSSGTNYEATIAACNTSVLQINVTDGAVIHDNDEQYTIMANWAATTATMRISAYMLGGAPYNWVDNWIGADSVTNYDADETIEWTYNDRRTNGWTYATTYVSTADGTVSGLDRVTTYIYGNVSAVMGSAIGTNGEVYIGKSDGDVTLKIGKVWDGSIIETPESVTVDVYATDSRGVTTTIETLTLSEENEWSAEVKHLPRYDSVGGTYTYSVSETTEGYYVVTDAAEEDDGDSDDSTKVYSYTLTNYAAGGLTVSKTVYSGDSEQEFSFTVTLSDTAVNGVYGEMTFADGVASFTLKDGESKTAEGLPAGVTYTVAEDGVDGYAGVITVDGETADTAEATIPADDTAEVRFINIETMEISGTKSWDDNDDQDGKRPESVTIRLYADGVEIDSVTVTAEDEWAYSFTGLAKYRDSGTEIIYSVTEDAVSGYTTTYDGYDVTNSYTPGQVSVTVTKAWDDNGDADGLRPESVTVTLMKDGVATDETVTLSAENNWTASFTGLDEYTDGKVNTYTVQEAETAGYTSVVTGDMKTGYIITNSHIVTTPTPSPSSSSTPTPSSSTKPGNSVNTGDEANIILYAAATLLALAGLGAALLLLRRQKRAGRR